MSNYFAIMSLNNDNPETSRDVQTNPLTVAPPEDNNHGAVNPSDGKPIDKNIPSIGSPGFTRETTSITKMVSPAWHQFPGISRIITIPENTNTANSGHATICCWSMHTHSCNVFFNCFHRLLGHSPRYRHVVISVGDRDNNFLSGGFLLLATCCSFCWKYR